MDTPSIHPQKTWGIRRRNLLKAGLAASATLSAWPLQSPSLLWGSRSGAPQARWSPARLGL
jgi:hypothetical protein